MSIYYVSREVSVTLVVANLRIGAEFPSCVSEFQANEVEFRIRTSSKY